MFNATRFAEALRTERMVAIVRLHDHTNAVVIAETLVEAGVQFLELTIERPTGLAALAEVLAAVGDHAWVGAGTVRRVGEVAAVADLGATFVVMPDTNVDVITASRERGLVTLPGAFTPTEVATAEAAGADFVKLFPASTGGIGHLKALRGPFPTVSFIPTGGVSAENAGEWLAAGAVAVAMGSNLVPSSGSLDGLAERARACVEATRGFSI
jgi:2-dehydro-3-deoxyphosphogluconate aldolase/(4S)-4-hydroxy-2-oxoglutarate aldolase